MTKRISDTGWKTTRSVTFTFTPRAVFGAGCLVGALPWLIVGFLLAAALAGMH